MTSNILNFPHVSIIILNWNGWKDTIECLESLYQIDYPNYDVIVVDNASDDNSIKKIKEYCQGKLRIETKHGKYKPDNKPITFFEYKEQDLVRNNIKLNSLYRKLAPNKKLTLILNHKNYLFVVGNNIAIKLFALKQLNSQYVLLLNNDTTVENRFLSDMIKVAEADEKIGLIGPKICYYSNSVMSALNWDIRIHN